MNYPLNVECARCGRSLGSIPFGEERTITACSCAKKNVAELRHPDALVQYAARCPASKLYEEITLVLIRTRNQKKNKVLGMAFLAPGMSMHWPEGETLRIVEHRTVSWAYARRLIRIQNRKDESHG